MKTFQELKELASANKLPALHTSDFPEIIGKRIQTIYFGYRGQDGIDDFIVGEMVSSWDLAGREDYTNIDPRYKTRQDYWQSYMTEQQIRDEKNRMTILTAEGKPTYINTDLRYDDGFFWCSDSDRIVRYRIVE